MNYTQSAPIKTETKVALGILALTVAIIVGGITIFKKNALGTESLAGELDSNISKYVQIGLGFDKNKVSPEANPKITGTTGTYTGTSTGRIEITEFLDYECPACASSGEPLVQELLKTYGSRLTITRRIFPVHGEPAIKVARMVLAAQDVSHEAYQTLHSKVFETQNSWTILGASERDVFFKKLTADLGLDYDMLVKAGNTEKYARQIDQDKSDAISLGIKATPSFIINNNVRVTGGVPLKYLETYIDAK